MKAEHRRELKTNELAEWIANLPQWAKDNLTTIVVVGVIIGVAAASYFYYNYQAKVVSARERLRLTQLLRALEQDKQLIISRRAQNTDYSFVLLTSAKDLLAFAEGTKDDELAAMALIKRGEALRSEMHYRPATVSEQELSTRIASARESYRRALEKDPDSASLRVLAKLGLGLCEEELGNFDKAKQIYGEIVADPNFESTTAWVQAKRRLETMDDYKKRVAFRALPRPQPPLPALDANLAVTPAGPTLPPGEDEPLPTPPLDISGFNASLSDVNLTDTELPSP